MSYIIIITIIIETFSAIYIACLSFPRSDGPTQQRNLPASLNGALTVSKMARRGLKLCQTLKHKAGVGATGREVAPFGMRRRYSRTLGRSRAQAANSWPWNHLTVNKPQNLVPKGGGSNCTGGHHLGPERVAVIRSRGVAAKQGFLTLWPGFYGWHHWLAVLNAPSLTQLRERD